jgi:hypothetical protein
MTTVSQDDLAKLLATELSLLWAAHHAVGLKGYMRLYSPETQIPFRTQQAKLNLWFGANETEDIIKQILHHYNFGSLPNTPLLLNPIVHTKLPDGTYKPLGSGIAWCTALCLGVEGFQIEAAERLWGLGAHASTFHRGENKKAGLKAVAILNEAQTSTDGETVPGCKELYDLTNFHSDLYAPFYLLSGMAYLTNNGLFQHPDVAELFPKSPLTDAEATRTLVKEEAINLRKITDAAYCWEKYERHHSLYEKFGSNPDDVELNLNFFNLVARDVELFDATGPMRKDSDAIFEFLVPGFIPRGSVTLLAGSGGTGKSSLAHQLCIIAATDYEPGEEPQRWLGQRIAIEKCNGICIYFSGEDGPSIINARAAILDPHGRARRLMFQRTEFADNRSFRQQLKILHKIPNVPLLVIDPARKYLEGDEEDSSTVSIFFEAIEEFAIKKNSSVVIVHHLQKNAAPKSTLDLLDTIRGSQVFVDRSRVVIGFLRDGPYTIAGLAKNNIPPNLGMVMEERVFARDPQKLDLIWLPGQEGVRNAALPPEELQKIAKEAHKEGRD